VNGRVFCILHLATSLALGATALRAQDCDPASIHLEDRALLIRDLAIVESAESKGTGPLSFWAMLEASTRPPATPGAVLDGWLTEWAQPAPDQFRPVRPFRLTQFWPKDASGQLDPVRAPLRLLAIVPRLDLRHDPSSFETSELAPAGELRFIFGATNLHSNEPLPFTVIFEFQVQGSPFEWARTWNDVAGTDDDALRLQKTLAAVRAALQPRLGPSGWEPAIGQVRTNDFLMVPEWELREFTWSAEFAGFRARPVARTPMFVFNAARSSELMDWIAQNRSAVLSGNFVLPSEFLGFVAPVPRDNFKWFGRSGADAALDEATRHAFSKTTCNGCHSGETDTRFLHIEPRWPLMPALVSNFMLAELPRRRADLERLLCEGDAAVAIKRNAHDVH
jgi:hypothetical protein